MKLKNLLLFVTLSSLFIFPSCSSDNDSPEEPSVKKVLIKIQGGYQSFGLSQNQINYENITYDSSNRVISYNDGESGKYTISYSSNKISVSNGNSSEEYIVTNGLITNGNGMSYSYDSENHLTGVNSTLFGESYSWSGNNMVKAESEEGNYTYTYNNNASTIAAIYNLFFSTSYLDCVNPFLSMSGCFGKMSKNLLESQSYIEGGKTYFDRKYEYELDGDGYPTVIKVTDEDGDIQKYNLTWMVK